MLKANIVLIFPKERHSKLIDPCRTRWIEQLEALDRFQELYEAIMITLEQISKDEQGGHSGWNNDSRRDAAALFNTCSDFGFIVTLVVVHNILSYTHAATVKLQRSQGDILKAYNDIDLIIETLQNTVKKILINSMIHGLNRQQNWLGRSVSPHPNPKTC